MKKVVSAIWLMIIPLIGFGQKLMTKENLEFFFDNTEFARSSYTVDQTMAGVHLRPEIGMGWDKKHAVFGGVDFLKRFGSQVGVDKTALIAYYQYKDEKTLFQVGSFNKIELLSDYSSFFFQDSVKYYQPTMNGLFFKKGNDKRNIKLWFDWTGLQSETIRESFFLGASGHNNFNTNLFSNFQMYVFHFAGTKPALPDQHVCDNVQIQASIGYKYADKNWNKVLISGGVLAGFERNRKFMDDPYMPIGFAGQVDAEFKQWGTENLIYAGQSRMKMYSEFGNQFYWGNPFLRGNFYLQNKLYWNVIKNKKVNGQLSIRNHFSEGKVYFEQLFTLSVNLGS